MIEVLRCTVNNKPVEVGIDPRESLADVLRERLGLTSVKKGCEVGECGACTVLVDGTAIDSCIYLGVWAQGKSILTVEGLQEPDGGLSPIQRAFVEEAAVQCGFCTPGIIMSAVEIVGSGKQYTREDHDLSQAEMAKILRVSQATYSRYETGRLDIPSQTLIALARYYGVSVDYLLGLDHRR